MALTVPGRFADDDLAASLHQRPTFRNLVSAASHRLLRAEAFAAWRDAVARAT